MKLETRNGFVKLIAVEAFEGAEGREPVFVETPVWIKLNAIVVVTEVSEEVSDGSHPSIELKSTRIASSIVNNEFIKVLHSPEEILDAIDSEQRGG